MIGELCALAAALLWSVSVILFKRSEAITPMGINLFKNVLGTVLLTITLLLIGGGVDMERSGEDWLRLVASGIVGIAIADTLVFMALRRLGAALLAVVDCAYTPVTVGMSVLMLGERPTPTFLVGASMVVGGLFYATSERSRGGELDTQRRRGLARGVLLGMTGIGAMGVGIVIAKPVLDNSGLVEVTLLRLVAGVGAQLIWIGVRPGQRDALKAFVPGPAWRTLLPASVLGSYLALMLWLGGFKWALVSTAVVLNQLSSVFTIVLARIVLRETVSRRRALGAAGAISGALVVLLL